MQGGQHTEARGREEEEEEEEEERATSTGGSRGGAAGTARAGERVQAAARRWRARGVRGTVDIRRRAAVATRGEEEDVEETGGGWRQRPGRGGTRRWRRDGRHTGHEARRQRSPTDRRVRPCGGGGGEAEGAPEAAGDGHYEAGGLVHQDQDPGLRRMTETILKAIEDRRRQEEEATASAALAARPPSWLAALEIVTRPSLVVPLAVLTMVAVALSQGWLKLEPVDLGEIVKDLYSRRREQAAGQLEMSEARGRSRLISARVGILGIE
ncbi:hypothetical protein ACP4OV_029531 [Aristida adscensionis]